MQWATCAGSNPTPPPPQEEPPGRAGCWEPWLSLWPFPTVSGRQEERSIALRRDAVWLFGPCCGWGAQKGFGLHMAALPPASQQEGGRHSSAEAQAVLMAVVIGEVRGVLASPGCSKRGRGAAGLRSSVLP